MEPETVPDKLLFAAARLSGTGREAFTAEDLIVAAWQAFPDTFGLQGYADEYPDSNRVLTNVMGGKGLAGKGYIERVGEKLYRLTTAGLAAAASFSGGTDAEQRAALTRELVSELARLVDTRAFQKFTQGKRETITERDVLKFLGLTARSDGNRARARLTSVQEAVSAAHTAIAEAGGKPVSVHRTQHSLAREDVDDLQACYQYIREAFAEELSHLLAR